MDSEFRIGEKMGRDTDLIHKEIFEADALPPCPAVFQQVAEVVKDPSSNARDLGNVLMTDAALSGKLLKIVNSAFFGLSKSIGTVTQAVIILGFNEVKTIAYAIPAKDMYNDDNKNSSFDVSGVWNHSIRVATIMRHVAYHINYSMPEEFFVAGIIHDIGQVVLNNVKGEMYGNLQKKVAENNLKLADAERFALHIDHAEVGAMLAEKWMFPDALVCAIRHHHTDISKCVTSSQIEAATWVVSFVDHHLTEGGSTDGLLELLPRHLCESLNLDDESLITIITKGKEDYEAIHAMFEN